jgi:hypothetical protein
LNSTGNTTEFSKIVFSDIPYDLLGFIMFIIMIGFVLFYIILSLIYGDKLLSSRPTEGIDPAYNEEVYEEWIREQNFSAVLAGFAIASLTLVLSLDNLKQEIWLVQFASFAFILEMISFISFKYMDKRFYEFLGTLLQFAGLLALLNGFMIFIIKEIGLTYILIIAYFIGYLGFFILSSKQLNTYIYSMRHS